MSCGLEKLWLNFNKIFKNSNFSHSNYTKNSHKFSSCSINLNIFKQEIWYKDSTCLTGYLSTGMIFDVLLFIDEILWHREYFPFSGTNRMLVYIYFHFAQWLTHLLYFVIKWNILIHKSFLHSDKSLYIHLNLYHTWF